MNIWFIITVILILLVAFRVMNPKMFEISKGKKKQLDDKELIVALMAKICKSDGHISEAEALFVGLILDELAPNQADREELKEKFNYYKDSQETPYNLACELAKCYQQGSKKISKHKVVYMLLNLIYIDGNFNMMERKMMDRICSGLEIGDGVKAEIFARFEREFKEHDKARKERKKRAQEREQERQQQEEQKRQERAHKAEQEQTKQEQAEQEPAQPVINEDSDWGVLGLPDGAPLGEVKKAWRALVKQYHPDILMGMGKNQQIISEGTRKIQEINLAYENLKAKLAS